LYWQGIRFHGLTISDCQALLPPAPGGKEIIAESMLWLLLTGQVPTEAQTRELSRELAEKGDLPSFVEKLIDSYVGIHQLTYLYSLINEIICRLPKTLHPMTQLGIGVAALNHDSVFQAAYEKGMKKKEYWAHTFDDCINLVAKLPALAARIYRNVYHPENQLPSIDKNLDLVGVCSKLAFGKGFEFVKL
jgi:citrate synthase